MLTTRYLPGSQGLHVNFEDLSMVDTIITQFITAIRTCESDGLTTDEEFRGELESVFLWRVVYVTSVVSATTLTCSWRRTQSSAKASVGFDRDLCAGCAALAQLVLLPRCSFRMIQQLIARRPVVKTGRYPTHRHPRTRNENGSHGHSENHTKPLWQPLERFVAHPAASPYYRSVHGVQSLP